jgi:ketosteroid isomerase-like protein
VGIEDNEAVAARWIEGLTGDWSILADLTSPTMRVWHSTDGIWLDRDEANQRMAQTDATASPPPFKGAVATATQDGFIVKAWIDGVDGGRSKTHIMQVLVVDDGKITSVEEYIAPETASGPVG